MAKNLAPTSANEGAFDATVRRAVNNNIPDVSVCSAQFLADSGTTGTTLTNVSGLVTNVLEPGTYRVRANIIAISTANGGLKLAFKQGTANMLSSLNINRTALSSGGSGTAVVTSTTDQASIVAATTAYAGVLFDGVIVVALPGTLQLQAAQNASHADDTTVELGSFMEFLRIA